MTTIRDTSRDFRLEREYQPQRLFEHAVYNHWDPYGDVPTALLEDDRDKLIADDLTEEEFEEFTNALALFGAGEEAVTEDLAPLMLVLDDINDQMYVASQIYDEAKHTQFFDRYWREVVIPVADGLGYDRVYPTNQRFFMDGYISLFDKTEAAMHRLLEDDTPRNRARAFCHYHLVVESLLAQTAYYGFESAFGSYERNISARDYPNLDGLLRGIEYVRADEGRHVQFGMFHVQQLIGQGVGTDVIEETMASLVPDVIGTLDKFSLLFKAEHLVEYAHEKYARRLETITDVDGEIPPAEELVHLDEQAAPGEH